jgi:hypothetical protein
MVSEYKQGNENPKSVLSGHTRDFKCSLKNSSRQYRWSPKCYSSELSTFQINTQVKKVLCRKIKDLKFPCLREENLPW